MLKIVHVAVEKVQTTGLQTRVAIDPATVREYAEAVTEGGVTLPPIVAFKTGDNIWCADGLHRLAAAKQTGQKTIAADVRDGGRVDALRYALGANGAHGLRRTNADKAHAVRMAYEHRAELGLPDVPAANLIAEIVGVSDKTVTDQLRNFRTWAEATARTGADGKTYTLPPIPTRPRQRSEVGGQMSVGTAVAAAESPRAERPGHLSESAAGVAPTELPPVPVRRRAAPETGTQDAGPVDCRGRHIPVDLLSVWNRRAECQELATAISRVRVALAKSNEGHDPLWWELNYQAVKAQLDQAFFSVSAAQPWCVCPMCQGIGCRACNNRGLMSEYRFEHAVPEEFKK
jgi:hypothetical protein